MTTAKLDEIAEQFIRDNAAIPGFKGYRGYPATLCISVNEEVVHGIPDKNRFIKEGDIVSLDCGVIKDKFIMEIQLILFLLEMLMKKFFFLLRKQKNHFIKGIEKAVAGMTIGRYWKCNTKLC